MTLVLDWMEDRILFLFTVYLLPNMLLLLLLFGC